MPRTSAAAFSHWNSPKQEMNESLQTWLSWQLWYDIRTAVGAVHTELIMQSSDSLVSQGKHYLKWCGSFACCRKIIWLIEWMKVCFVLTYWETRFGTYSRLCLVRPNSSKYCRWQRSLQLTLRIIFTVLKAARPFFVTNNRYIPVKNTLGWSAVMLCACEWTRLFSVVFCLVPAAHKFQFRYLVKEIPNRLRLVERRSCSYKDLTRAV